LKGHLRNVNLFGKTSFKKLLKLVINESQIGRKQSKTGEK